jgi:O-antigen ligase
MLIVPAIIDHPLGYGTGSDSTTVSALYYSHNGFFYIAIELGIPGLLLALALLAWGVLQETDIVRRSSDPLLAMSGLWGLAWLVATLVEGSFGALLEVYPVNLYLWFLLGSHLALRRTLSDRRSTAHAAEAESTPPARAGSSAAGQISGLAQ